MLDSKTPRLAQVLLLSAAVRDMEGTLTRGRRVSLRLVIGGLDPEDMVPTSEEEEAAARASASAGARATGARASGSRPVATGVRSSMGSHLSVGGGGSLQGAAVPSVSTRTLLMNLFFKYLPICPEIERFEVLL